VNISQIVKKSKFEENNIVYIATHLQEKLPWYAKFDIKYITVVDVKHLIDKLDTNKSTEIDGIGPKFGNIMGTLFQ